MYLRVSRPHPPAGDFPWRQQRVSRAAGGSFHRGDRRLPSGKRGKERHLRKRVLPERAAEREGKVRRRPGGSGGALHDGRRGRGRQPQGAHLGREGDFWGLGDNLNQ